MPMRSRRCPNTVADDRRVGDKAIDPVGRRAVPLAKERHQRAERLLDRAVAEVVLEPVVAQLVGEGRHHHPLVEREVVARDLPADDVDPAVLAEFGASEEVH